MNDYYIHHYGVLGMKWGIRKERRRLAKDRKSVIMDLQRYSKKAKRRKTVHLGVKEYAHVMSELRSNITKEQKKHLVINKAIGEHIYTFENHFDDTYRVVGKTKIPEAATGLLERMNDGK